MDFLYRRILIAVLAIVSHPWATLAVVFLTAAVSAGAAIGWLTVSTDQNQLFSSKPWFFHDYLQFISHFRENEAVYIVIEPRDAVGFASAPGANVPIARWSLGPGSNEEVMIASEEAAISAPAMPCAARAAISVSRSGATPPASEAAPKKTSAVTNIRRWPQWSAALPASSRKPAKVIV